MFWVRHLADGAGLYPLSGNLKQEVNVRKTGKANRCSDSNRENLWYAQLRHALSVVAKRVAGQPWFSIRPYFPLFRRLSAERLYQLLTKSTSLVARPCSSKATLCVN
jgi:hypothetical protein